MEQHINLSHNKYSQHAQSRGPIKGGNQGVRAIKGSENLKKVVQEKK